MHTFRPRRVLIPVPSFSEYERAAGAIGAAIDYCPLSAEGDFSYPWDSLRAACGHVDCIIIGNPNNPTGTWPQPTSLRPLRNGAPERGRTLSSMSLFSIFSHRKRLIPSENWHRRRIRCSSFDP